ncbi:MAG: efflux RND transporter periplasmic adaptor subunit [Proteobacteria bacterium]|nr:efflux RND transporter periplasmic adaptor subunit [Pseudomonadota bacterium]
MKRSSLPLLMGVAIGAQALLTGAGPALLPHMHTGLDNFSKGGIITVAYAEEAAAVKYTCPMHPQIISDRPGKCPICSMDLVQIADTEHQHEMSQPPAQAEESAVQAPAERKVLYWYDPMVPGKKFDKPGKSPFMDMELVPKYADENVTSSGNKPVVSIPAENIQKMGVRTETVGKSSFGGGVRATGIVMPNERARVDMFSQVEGRIADLKYSAEGDVVKKGEVFYTLVSPELSGLQSDYIAALSGGFKDMAAAARKRMKLLGVDDVTLDQIAKTSEPFDNVPFHVPADGVLYKLEIRNGHYLKAGDEIGHIQDLSVVWVEAAVPEKDAATIEIGNTAKVLFSGAEQPYDATVDYVYPTVNTEARTVKIRLVVENKGGALKPSAYATVEFSSAAAERITVPSEAVLQNSAGSHVIVAIGGGKFQAHDVQTGMTSNGRTEILSGLKEGEEIVTSSQFMIDSESSLRESLEKLDHGKQ